MKATDVITVTHLGRTYRACRHCATHMERTIQRFTRRFPKAHFEITQPPWNTGVPASAGTHDKCSAYDLTVYGLGWLDAQKWFREQGFAAWYRPTKPGTWSAHLHMLSLGCAAPLGIYVPGQIADYYAHKSGLVGHVADGTWHPTDIRATVFVWTPPTPPAPPKPKRRPAPVRAALKALRDSLTTLDKAEQSHIQNAIDDAQQIKKR